MEGKRRALDEIAARQNSADEKRKKEAERRGQSVVVSESVVVPYPPFNFPPVCETVHGREGMATGINSDDPLSRLLVRNTTKMYCSTQ
jgi:hypothetical protein